MHPRAVELTEKLRLQPHPEGGAFAEVFRSSSTVERSGNASRSALTTIYFLLTAGQTSRWHRVFSDEAWHFYEGDPIELLLFSPASGAITRRVLGPVARGVSPVHVVPSGIWQAARPLGAYGLAGCSVGPGFDYADFALLRNAPQELALLRTLHPDAAKLV